jgi:hypothetical protein
MKLLFETKDAETSIHIKRAPLVAGSDVSSSKTKAKKKVSRSKTTPQGTAAWIAAAAKLLEAQRKLLFEKFGGAFVILDRFDFGPQVLFALAQRQRTHGDGLSFFISGLLQFNVLMLLCYTLYKFETFVLLFVVVTYLTDGASKTSFADCASFNVDEWQTAMLKLLHDVRKDKTGASNAVVALVNVLKTELEHQDALSLQPDSETAKQGETFLFDGRKLHWGNASKDLRLVVYSQAVHRGLLDKFCNNHSLRKTLLTSIYSSEFVVDRRTIASPAFLHHLWLYNSPDVLEITEENIAKQAKELWDKLSPLAIGLHWPSSVCQRCVNNDSKELVRCTAEHCQMGAIHMDCMPVTEQQDEWKCSSCQTSGK